MGHHRRSAAGTLPAPAGARRGPRAPAHGHAHLRRRGVVALTQHRRGRLPLPICLLGATLLLGACVLPSPSPTVLACDAGVYCDEVLVEARQLMERESMGTPTRVLVTPGRAPSAFHEEVHACFADGGYVLIDVFAIVPRGQAVGPNATPSEWRASLRENVDLDDPPCA